MNDSEQFIAELKDEISRHAPSQTKGGAYTRVLTYSDAMPNNYLRQARKKFAKSMTDDEVPLVMTTGAGLWGEELFLLVTQRNLFARDPKVTMPLDRVQLVTVHQKEESSGLGQSQVLWELRVNGSPMMSCSGRRAEAYLKSVAELLRATARRVRAQRQEAGPEQPLGKPVLDGPADEQAAAALIASAISSGSSDEEALLSVDHLRIDEAHVRRMLGEMKAIHHQLLSNVNWRGRMIASIAVGVVVFIVTCALAVGIAIAQGGRGPAQTVIMLVGAVVLVAAFSRAATARKKLKFGHQVNPDELLALWSAHEDRGLR